MSRAPITAHAPDAYERAESIRDEALKFVGVTMDIFETNAHGRGRMLRGTRESDPVSSLVLARARVWARMANAGLSYPLIAAATTGRSHATVHAAVAKLRREQEVAQ